MTKEEQKLLLNKNFYYVSTKISSVDNVYPIIFGYEKCSSKKRAIIASKQLYVLHFVLSGNGYLDNEKIGAHSIFVIRPNEKIIYKPDTANPWKYLWVEFSGPSCERVLNEIGFEHKRIIKFQNMDDIFNIFQFVFKKMNSYKNKESHKTIYKVMFDTILALINGESTPHISNKNTSYQEKNIQKIKEYIDLHYQDQNISIMEVAKHFSYTQSYLTRLFKKYTNLTPQEYVINLRMTKALDLIRTTDLSINNISIITGFNNQFYFSKMFKKYFGSPPSKYLKIK